MNKANRIIESPAGVRKLSRDMEEHFQVNGFALRVVVSKATKQRSLNQNSTMHLWFGEIATFTGDDVRSIKSDLKAHFLGEIEGLRGVWRTKDTHELTKAEMSEFMGHIQAFAADMGIALTQPPGK